MARTDKELEDLLCDLDSDVVERKSDLTDKSRVCQAICAFANDLPGHRTAGVVFIGAHDGTGAPTGHAITDKLLLDLAGLRDQGDILPRPTMVVGKRQLLGGDIAVVEVEPSPAPPVRYKGQVWIRVGPRRAIATVDDERLLSERRPAADLPFDARPVPGGWGRKDVTRVPPRLDVRQARLPYQRWMDRIPSVYRTHVVAEAVENVPSVASDPHCLAQLKHYHSLVPMAQEAHKPVFALRPADGAFGGHQQAVQRAFTDFEALAKRILAEVGRVR